MATSNIPSTAFEDQFPDLKSSYAGNCDNHYDYLTNQSSKTYGFPQEKQVKCINIKTVMDRNESKPWMAYKEWSASPLNVYVGRTNTYLGATGSKWGNIFKVDDFGREGCIDKFEEMLLKKWRVRSLPHKEKGLDNENIEAAKGDETVKRKNKEAINETIINRKTITSPDEEGHVVAGNTCNQEDTYCSKLLEGLQCKNSCLVHSTEIGKTNSWRFKENGDSEGYECKLTWYLSELRGKTLACWCKPLKCHSDVLANVLFELEVRGAFRELDEIEANVRDGEEKVEVRNCSPVKWDPPGEFKTHTTAKNGSNPSCSTQYDAARDYSVLTNISNELRKSVEMNQFGIPIIPPSKLPPWNPWTCCQLHLNWIESSIQDQYKNKNNTRERKGNANRNRGKSSRPKAFP
jgi:hypothetical protein